MWEDDRNRRGGRWVINLNKSQRSTSLDNFWLEVMLCLIGEAFDEHSRYVRKKKLRFYVKSIWRIFFSLQVNGAVVSIRAKGDKIGMWLGDSNAGESILTVGKKFKERLNIDPQVSISDELWSKFTWIESQRDLTFHVLQEPWNPWMTIFPIFCDLRWKSNRFFCDFTWNC